MLSCSTHADQTASADPHLAVIVVNYKTPELTLACLRSLAAQRADVLGLKVVVVENGSQDRSAEQLAAAIAAEHWDNWIVLRRCGANHGFAGGTNRGLAVYPRAAFYLLLNSDTVVHAGCLRHCLAAMAANATIAAYSCRVLNADGSLQVVARRFPTPARILLAATGLPWRWPRLFGWGQTEYTHWDLAAAAGDADWLGGAFLLIRGDVLRRIGPLDEDFFFYGEDIEFCHRVRRAAYRVHYDPTVCVTHLGGASSDPARLAPALRDAHRRRARYLYLRKCHGRLAVLLVRVVDTATCWRRAVMRCLTGRKGQPGGRDLRAAARTISGCPGTAK